MAAGTRETTVRAGGSATSAGILFEQQLGAMFGALMLAARPVDQRFNLGSAVPVWIRFETEAPVDDILVATSEGGFIAVQAKTTASLSTDLKSPFGKTISQFVRHWLACRDGDGKRHWNRPLDPTMDRLVLAIGRQAPASIRVDLRDALRLRSQAGGGVLTQAQDRAFGTYARTVELAWNSATSEAYDPEIAIQLARFICIFIFDPAGSDRMAILSMLGAPVTKGSEAASAMTALEAISGELMAQRGGADLFALRQSMLTRGVLLEVPTNYQRDIASLRAHSESVAETLKRYEVIEAAAGQPVSIERDCQAQLLAAALVDSFLIVGEPGSGKSGVLNALARDLRARGKDVLELAVDRFSVETLEGLKQELRLDHPLLEVLDAWDGEDDGWVIIDALDATRGGKGEGVFRTVIDKVLERNGRWKEIASIRTFDLRMGQQFRALFQGAPPVEGLQEPGFSGVRHVRVPTWSAAEFDRLLQSAPRLSSALANASSTLRDLAAVPFNTRLLSDLVKDGLVTVDFSHVASQAELLQLYWDHRVEQLGMPARLCVKRIVDAMVTARALRAPIDVASGNDPATIDALSREGVIIAVDNDRWIQFRHHLLFDFAAARTLLAPEAIIDGSMRFPKEDALGMMLAPALAFLLREIWDRGTDRAEFWTAVSWILADKDSDPVIRSSTGRICAEYPLVSGDMQTLATRIVNGDGLAATTFVHTGGALAVRIEDHPDFQLPPWVDLLRTVAQNVAIVSNTFRFLLFKLTGFVTDPDQRADMGFAARALLEHGLALEQPRSMVSSAVDLVADTFDTDRNASRTLLTRIFEPARMNVHGPEEVPAVARKIDRIGADDPAFAADIYRYTYDFAVSEDRETRMGDSQIMALRSNARQDYDMARYALGEYLPTFLRSHPDHAVDAIVDAVDGYVAREHPIAPELADETLFVGARQVRVREDWSHIWAHDPESTYGHDAEELIKKLVDHLRETDERSAIHIAERLVGRANLAVFWARLFLVAVNRNDGLIGFMLPFAMCRPFLMNADTRKDAVDVIARGYESLPLPEREAFEASVQTFDFSDFAEPDIARESFLRRLYGAIGEKLLATGAARAIARVEGDPDNSQNDRLFVIRSINEAPEAFHWIEGLNRDLPANRILMDAIEITKSVLGIDQPSALGESTAAALKTVDAVLFQLEELVSTINRGTQATGLILYAEGIVGQSLERVIGRKLVPTDQDTEATARFCALLALVARSAGPVLGEDTEVSFEHGASWGSPAPRVEAAQAVLDLILQRPDLYEELEPTIDALLADTHPAVRLQAGLRLLPIWDRDRAGFWRKLTDRLGVETNLGVLDHLFASVLGRVLHEDPTITEQLVIALLERFADEPDRQVRVRYKLSDIVSILWVTYHRPQAGDILAGWIASSAIYHSELTRILATMRGAFVAGLSSEPEPKDDDLRQRSMDLAMRIVDAASTALAEHFSQDTPSAEQIAIASKQAQLLDAACRELYFAIGAGSDSSKSSRPIDEDGLAIFFEEATPILKRIGDYATPHTVYYLLKLLEFVLPVDPETAFVLTANALRKGGQLTGYQYESLGADLLVRLVGVFLADHKELFENDDRRAALIECLEIFMEAGWPAARRLLYRLPELIQ